MVKIVENRDESEELETPPPSKRPRRSVNQQKKPETPKKEEPKSKKSKPSSPAKKDTEKNPKTPKRTSGIVFSQLLISNHMDHIIWYIKIRFYRYNMKTVHKTNPKNRRSLKRRHLQTVLLKMKIMSH